MKNKYYLVVNQAGEAYSGMIQGDVTWTLNWNNAKLLLQESTERLLQHYPGTELLEV